MALIECGETVRVEDGAAVLVCYLPPDHDGPHYDAADDVTWKRGKPDGVQ